MPAGFARRRLGRGTDARTQARGIDHGYLAERRYMAECISTGAKPAIVTGPDALESMTIVEAEVKSVPVAKRGQEPFSAQNARQSQKTLEKAYKMTIISSAGRKRFLTPFSPFSNPHPEKLVGPT